MLGVLLLISAAIAGPAIYFGYRDLHDAQTALAQARYQDAEGLFESAARRLFWRADLWERAGLAAYRAQNYSEAIRLLEIARGRRSLSAPGWDALGLACWWEDDHKTALEVWQAGSQAYPQSSGLYDHLAMAYHEIGDYSAEQDALTKRLVLAPDAAADYRLGLLLMLSDSSRAYQQLSAASALDHQFDSAVQTLHASITLSEVESHPARRLIDIGRGLGLVEEWALADRAFEDAIADDQHDAEAWAWLGEARQHIDQDGSDALNQALTLDPRDTLVRALRGLYWKRQRKYALALVEYSQAAQLEPANPVWQASLGETYAQNGDLVSALAAYQKATQLAPTDAAYWRLLATFCSDNDIFVLDIGLPAAQQAVQLAPDDPQALDALGWADANAGLFNAAEQNLLQAIKLAPDLAIAHLHLAQTYLRIGDRASATAELKLAIQSDPNGSAGQFAAQVLKQYFP